LINKSPNLIFPFLLKKTFDPFLFIWSILVVDYFSIVAKNMWQKKMRSWFFENVGGVDENITG